MNHKQIFSDNLKRFMKENGKSRREVSASLGISYYTFSDWVNAKKMPRMDKVEQLAEYFGCRKSDLIEDRKKPAEDDELSKKKKDFISKVMQMSDLELDQLDQILHIIESTRKAGSKTPPGKDY